MGSWPELWRLRQMLLGAVTIGWAGVALKTAWTGLLRRPAFFSYCFLLACKGAQWLADSRAWYRVTEPPILLVNVLVVTEAWWAVARQDSPYKRRTIAARLLALGALLALPALMLPEESNPVRAFNHWRLAVHVVLAIFSAGFCFARWPADQHFRILAIHQASRMLDFINYSAARTLERRWTLYYWQQFPFLAASLGCLILWLGLRNPLHEDKQP